MSERKLKAWEEAGLVDAATADHIRAWEAENSRPYALWALIGMGALAIGLGLISVVAANWDDIPGKVRLAIHMLLMVALAAGIIWRVRKHTDQLDYFNDALLFIFGALTLSFFGHLGQVYQTGAPLWQPLLAWTIMITPLLLIWGRGWPVAAMWVAAIVGTACSHAQDFGYWIYGSQHDSNMLYWGLIVTPPMFAAALAAWMRDRSSRPAYWRHIEQLSVFVILAGVSIMFAIRTAGGFGDYDMGATYIQSACLAATAFVIYLVRKGASGQAIAGILGVAALMHLVSLIVSESSVGLALCFMLLWVAVAYGAIHAGWRIIFQLAVAILAIRLIILSFELADDLLGSGMGLILAGIFTLGIAWIAVRISRQYAPKGDAV